MYRAISRELERSFVTVGLFEVVSRGGQTAITTRRQRGKSVEIIVVVDEIVAQRHKLMMNNR